MTHAASENQASILFIPHGGGPMPLLDDPGHASLIAFLKNITGRLGTPEAIVVISAHWECPVPTLTGSTAPPMLYDYGGFPPETYEIRYPAPGNPALAEEIATLLQAQSIPVAVDPERGYDHGVFVPLMLMYPEATIPCIQLSLLNNLDAAAHLALGRALASLRQRNILVLGSGMSFHNLRSFFAEGLVSEADNHAFEDWLQQTCAGEAGEAGEAERLHRLAHWQEAPAALKCHPRPEHLLPLHVCAGMAEGAPAEIVFSDAVIGRRVTGLLWR